MPGEADTDAAKQQQPKPAQPADKQQQPAAHPTQEQQQQQHAPAAQEQQPQHPPAAQEHQQQPPQQEQHPHAPAAPAHPPPPQQHHQQQQVTLDAAREHFYVAHRACERFSTQLGAFVARLQQARADEAWLSEVQAEAQRVALFHQQQQHHWGRLSADIDAYVDSVRALAEKMAVADLKGEETEEAELSENKARTIHPELQRFQLEKKARILGKIGGVPALGPGMASVLPSMPRGSILKATASPAAREIYYSKMEDKDAAQLAGVFQFRKSASSDVSSPTQWQQEAKAKNVRRQSEAAADELRRQHEQDEQLVKGGAAELAGVLRGRQQALKAQEEEAAAAAASSYRRVSASGSTANADLPIRELQEATPQLAVKLKQRQAAADKAGRLLSDEEAAAAGGGGGDDTPPSWSNAAAPFGGELAALLRKRRESDDAKAAAAPVKATPAVAVPAIGDAASAELAARLKQRASRLGQQQGQDQEQQEDQQGGAQR